MSQPAQFRKYERAASAVFSKTKEVHGGLSNMAPGFPIDIDGRRYRTSEALYQACRFPHLPDVQEAIVGQNSPMTAKQESRARQADTRADWDHVRVAIMKWCLKAKLIRNRDGFGELLRATQDKPIVEESWKDDFWGARPRGWGALEGGNVLGRLLMELREKMNNAPETLLVLEPVPITDFLLFDKPVPVLKAEANRQANGLGL